ncbi:hypothetical protein [Mycolicibacterium aichiense]|uniref:Integral membrane protein n=1 Tax=Mycolicibacterium aichiense TaxID=1799 RepID=A0AAD1HLZ1_9MYCO|nr:hypothetical protein [Mycolicibacterium aichiense]MCV7020184.1 hypothetical protein [Mycolicibacterium aichiense]BBX07780.1 hypothetical protein MAIC_25830 [Mycolicibacterium aichiense]STZ81592.1 putative transmembrane protein [Mycolicibacterium aichiense]
MTVRRLVAALFGLAMIAAASVGADTRTLAAAAVALIAVLAGLYVPAAATPAVLAAMAALVLTEPHPMLAATSGVCAAAYLVLTYAVLTRATAAGIAGFAAAGALATTVPVDLPWLPLLAPVAAVVAVAVVLSPYVDIPQAARTGPAATTPGDTTPE